jgi:hypothetical protein
MSIIAPMALLIAIPSELRAQDIPGIEICTVEKTMERRTSCLQSNVDFLQKSITKLAADHQQKLDAANRQIDGLKAAVVSLQKTIDDLQSAQKKSAGETAKKTDAPPAKDAAPATAPKDGAK